MRQHKIAAICASVLLAVCSRPMIAQVCVERNLEKHPQWISGLEFNTQTEEILISDPTSKVLLAYNIKTGKIGEVEVPRGVPPTSITKIQGGFLIKNRDDATIIGPTYKSLLGKDKTINLRTTKGGGLSELGSLYSNWITKGPTFVGFGGVANFNAASTQYNPSRNFELGFIKGQFSASSGEMRNIQLLEATEENNLYLLGFPYFAANDDGFFFVKLTKPRAAIVQVREIGLGRSALQELAAFPDKFRALPNLNTEYAGAPKAPSVAELFERIEESRMVVGLFGQGKLLYLVARQPDPSGEGTEWLVYQINPVRSEPLGVVRLPTNAHHLSIVVGQDSWYLFQRGVVRAWGDQDITSVLKVPVKWITSPETSPLNGRHSSARDVKCVKQ